MNWQTYLTDEFPQQLTAYAAEHPDTSTCVDHPHCCQAPQERRVLFEQQRHAEQLSPALACVWYGLTLVEQTIFHYFPEKSELWLSQYPEVKLPVTWAGMGCVKVMPPRSLIRSRDAHDLFDSYAIYFSGELQAVLNKVGIPIGDFLLKLHEDKDIDLAHPKSPDLRLFNRIKERCSPNTLKIKLTYLDPHDDSLNLVEAVQDRKLHYIAFAQPGLTQAFALAEFSPGVGDARARSLFSQVNKAGETGTLLPRRHLTFLPTPAASYGGMDTTTYRENGYSPTEIRTHLQDAIQAHLQYARCDALYFDFREGPVDAQLYHDCLQECLAETEFPEGTRVTTWK